MEGKRYPEHLTPRRAHREISLREICEALRGHRVSGPGGKGTEQGKLEIGRGQDTCRDVSETQLHSRSAHVGSKHQVPAQQDVAQHVWPGKGPTDLNSGSVSQRLSPPGKAGRGSNALAPSACLSIFWCSGKEVHRGKNGWNLGKSFQEICRQLQPSPLLTALPWG